PEDRIVMPVDDALFQGDDGVIGDVDVLRADLRAAFGDVAEADPEFLADDLEPILIVEGVHLQRGGADEETRPAEFFLLRVISEDVADVLAEEALDALA